MLAGPDVVAAGLFVTGDLGESVISDPRLAALAGGVSTPDELRALVRVNLDHGVDVIKTRATERAGLPEQDPRKQTYTYFVHTYSTVVDITEPSGDYDNPALRIRGQAMLPYIRRAIQHAHQMGVKIVAGGDTPYGPGSVVRIPHEVVRFVELGMTPLEAIQSATTVAAELLGIERRTGALQEGLEADPIVVGGNPLEDITSIQDVQVVISNGRVALNRLPFGK